MTAPRQVFDMCVIAHVLEIFMGHNSSIAKSHHHNRKIDPREKVKIFRRLLRSVALKRAP